MYSDVIRDEKGKTLLQIARLSIARALKVDDLETESVDTTGKWLSEPGATFITLTQYDRLRGCIGSLQMHQTLLENVRNNAVSAALHDNRFLPVTAEELDSIRVEVSVLSALQPMAFSSEADALAQLRPGIDGVMFEWGVYRSTFLPQVWESLPQPRDFLAQLKLKAGLNADFWNDTIHLSRYTVQKWRETDYREEKSNG
ncbi:MAG: AmmeMemoRadiSam system protein A [Burkholderiales bacterium]|nr:AmmeMemoRadiSam system protein A [Nitrosomonas sp.]MCP5274968.1 AmmeMemoRadiSam system protein A [Burkholderiales bacterium]